MQNKSNLHYKSTGYIHNTTISHDHTQKVRIYDHIQKNQINNILENEINNLINDLIIITVQTIEIHLFTGINH